MNVHTPNMNALYKQCARVSLFIYLFILLRLGVTYIKTLKTIIEVDCLFFRADSGFRRVEAKKYSPRLLHVFGEKVSCSHLFFLYFIYYYYFFCCHKAVDCSISKQQKK